MTRTIEENKRTHHVQYESITDLYEHIMSLGDSRDNGAELSSVSDARGYSWDFNLGYEGALEMAKNGGYWPKGAKDLQAVDLSESFNASEYQVEPIFDNAVIGGAVDIGAYLSNDPECFFHVEETPTERPIVRVVVCVGASASVEADDVLNRSRAVLALIDALEMQGYSCELIATRYNKSDAYIAQHDVVVKQAGEPWSAASVAFPLAHIGFGRRLGFRLVESAPNGIGAYISNDGYGNGMAMKKPGNADLFFGYIVDGSEYSTPEKALETVLDIAHEQQPTMLKKKGS